MRSKTSEEDTSTTKEELTIATAVAIGNHSQHRIRRLRAARGANGQRNYDQRRRKAQTQPAPQKTKTWSYAELCESPTDRAMRVIGSQEAARKRARKQPGRKQQGRELCKAQATRKQQGNERRKTPFKKPQFAGKSTV